MQCLEEDNGELEAWLSLYTTGITILNDPSEEGSISALRGNALDRLQSEGPRGAKLSMMRDICEWDIGGRENSGILSRLANTSTRDMTVAFIESVCLDLIGITTSPPRGVPDAIQRGG